MNHHPHLSTAAVARILLLALPSGAAIAQGDRPPAVPLVAVDPYFSVWSFNDRLTDTATRHWTGTTQSLTSLVRVDGTSYRIMGDSPRRLRPLPQLSVSVLPTRTIYEFAGAGVRITLTFLTPLLPQDLDLYERPVSYLMWEARSIDGKPHSVQLYFDATGELVVDQAWQQVTGEAPQTPGLTVLRMGSAGQPILAKKGDNLRIDWGYLYAAARASDHASAGFAYADDARGEFARRGTVEAGSRVVFPRRASARWPVMAFSFDLGTVSEAPVSRRLILAYDDLFSIEYLGKWLRPYWRRHGAEAPDLLRQSDRDFDSILERCVRFDDKLLASLRAEGGERYAELASLSFRQSLAAQKLVAGPNGQPYYFPKENFSNGCIGTVDVIYPEAPLLLLLNPKLLEATIEPVLDYAQSGRWPFPFAPHDLGTYPLADGQVYGGGEKSETDQMPVEESGDLLLLAQAIAHAEGNASFAERYWALFTKWAEYLRSKGLDPENQLSTDDFAGHLAHNANLSLKAILALEAYSRLAASTGRAEVAADYHRTAQAYVGEWMKMANDGDHTRLAFDKSGTWSQKYNLVWDRILGYDLFPPELARSEVAFYLSKLNRFGLPLDSRKSYTKLDWELWSATLADSRADFERLVAPLAVWVNETPSRVPLTDWYDTVSGKQQGFQARSVVGGLFIKMLANGATWAEWLRNPG